MTRQILTVALQGLGYSNLYTANCGEDAFALLKSEEHFDVLICDIQMPGIDGLTFLREATEVGEIGAVITYSAIAHDLRLAIQQLARLTGYQVLGDLGKPFTRDELKELLLRYRPRAPRLPQLMLNEFPSASEIKSSLELEDGKFIPYYQPKINLQTMEVVGVEVLARWQHPQRGLLAPGTFLEAVQHFGFLNAMTKTLAQ